MLRNPRTHPANRRAKFIMPPNYIKQKVGTGGLHASILAQAENLAQEFTQDFMDDGYDQVHTLGAEIKRLATLSASHRTHSDIESIIYPAFQLQSNAALFGYDLLGNIASELVIFIEDLNAVDNKALQIISVFHATLLLILKARMKGDGGVKGKTLVTALQTACRIYYRNNK